MISSITLRRIGPVADLTISIPDAGGWTDIKAPSESFKSSLYKAFCLSVWGKDDQGAAFPTDAIHGDEPDGECVVQFAGKRRLRTTTNLRRVVSRGARKGEPCRVVEFYTSMDGQPDAQSRTESEHLGVLAQAIADGRGFGVDSDIARLIVCPMAWLPLMSMADGRKFRDVLVRLAPEMDLRPVVARLMAPHALLDTDPISESGATAKRKEAGRQIDQERGRVSTLEDEVAVAEEALQRDAGPTAEERAAAQAVLNLDGEWGTHTDASRRQADKVREHAAAQARLQDWQKRRDALGERPDGHEDGIAAARTRKADEASKATGARRVATDAKRAVDDAKAALDRAADAPDLEMAAAETVRSAAWDARVKAEAAYNSTSEDGCCPKCKRPGWAEAEAERAAAKDAVDAAEAVLAEAEANVEATKQGAPARREALLAPLRRTLADAQAALTAAQEAAEAQDERVSAAGAALEQALALGGDAARWDSSLQALGTAPVVPPEPDAAPRPPAQARPADEQVSEARATLKRAQDALAAGSARTTDMGALRGRLQEARDGLARVTAEYERLDALVSAVRAAPSEAMREWVGGLARDGVSFELVGDGGVRVLVDGRPWSDWISRGRRVVADLTLRAILRDTDGRPYLPLFVDDATAWSGDWPDVAGPVIRLLTEPGELRVSSVGGAA